MTNPIKIILLLSIFLSSCSFNRIKYSKYVDFRYEILKTFEGERYKRKCNQVYDDLEQSVISQKPISYLIHFNDDEIRLDENVIKERCPVRWKDRNLLFGSYKRVDFKSSGEYDGFLYYITFIRDKENSDLVVKYYFESIHSDEAVSIEMKFEDD